MSKVLVLGSEGLLGKAIMSTCGTIGVDASGDPMFHFDVFSDEGREDLRTLIKADGVAHVIDATYPSLSKPYTAYLETWDMICQTATSSLTLISSIFGVVASDYRVYIGTQVPPTPLWYTFFKGGVISATRHLAAQYANRRVRVNCISPGGVLDNQDAAFRINYARTVPLLRMATPQDISGTVAFLTSDAASYITGQNLIVDGGRTIW